MYPSPIAFRWLMLNSGDDENIIHMVSVINVNGTLHLVSFFKEEEEKHAVGQ